MLFLELERPDTPEEPWLEVTIRLPPFPVLTFGGTIMRGEVCRIPFEGGGEWVVSYDPKRRTSRRLTKWQLEDVEHARRMQTQGVLREMRVRHHMSIQTVARRIGATIGHEPHRSTLSRWELGLTRVSKTHYGAEYGRIYRGWEEREQLEEQAKSRMRHQSVMNAALAKLAGLDPADLPDAPPKFT
jgi:hypothetical protein